MSDMADQSDSEIEAQIEKGIAQSRRAPTMKPKGTCWYCDERVDPIKLFCNAACRADFEAEERQLKNSGRR